MTSPTKQHPMEMKNAYMASSARSTNDSVDKPRRRILPSPVPGLNLEEEEGQEYLVKLKGLSPHPSDANTETATANKGSTQSLPSSLQEQRNDYSNNGVQQQQHNRHHSDPDTFAVFTDNPNATYGRSASYCFLEALGGSDQFSRPMDDDFYNEGGEAPGLDFECSEHGERLKGSIGVDNLDEKELQRLSHPLAL